MAAETQDVTPRVLPKDPATEMRVLGLPLPTLKRWSLAIGLMVALIAPFLLESFDVFQLTLALIYAIAILGLNLLTGFNGQFSLGHSAFFALGAYTAAVLIDQWDVAYYWTVIPAGIICLGAGFLFGLPALRLDGLYLALATFALATATPQILKFSKFEHVTGGVQGLDVFKPDSPVAWLSNDQWYYYFTLLLMIIAFICAWNLVRGRTGRAMIAIRDNPIAAQAMGINTALYKSLTFAVSGMYTGLAGALAAIVIEYVAPDSFTFILAVTFLVGLVVGGVASIPGAIFGGFFILLIPNLSEWVADLSGRTDAKGLSWAVYGAFLILTVYVMPSGFAGLVRLAIHKLSKLKAL